MFAHTMQNMINDCGLAALETIFKQLKVKNVELTLSESMDSNQQGLSLLQLQEIMKSNGVYSEAYRVTDFHELSGQRFPIVCMIKRDDLPHYVVVHQLNQQQIIYSDPAEPQLITIDVAAFIETFMGYAICIEDVQKMKSQTKKSNSQLYKQIIQTLPFSSKFEIGVLTFMKYLIPLSLIAFMQYAMIYQMESITMPYFGMIALFFLTLMLIYYQISQKDIQIKTKLENQFQQKVLMEYYEKQTKNVTEKRNMDNIMGHFWNLLISVTGILNKLYLKFDLAFVFTLCLLIFRVDILLGIVVVAWLAVFVVMVSKRAKKIQNFEKGVVSGSNALSSTIEEQLRLSLDVHLFSKEEEASEKVRDKMADYFNKKLISNELSTAIDSIFEFISTCITLSIFGFLIYAYTFNKNQSITMLFLSVFIITLVLSRLRPIVQIWLRIQKSEQAVTYIQNSLAIDNPTGENEITDIGTKTIEHLSLKNLSFSYNEANKCLSGININFEKGKMTGISGKNGSGKSTLMKIILGVLKPDSGVIRINNKKFSSLHGTNITEAVNAYFPEMGTFKNTVERNIKFGLSNTQALKNQRIDYLKECMGLELADDHVIHAQGGNLSQGQIQKILLLRTLYEEKSVYMFDEPTTNLDQKSVDAFIKVLKALAATEDKIIILITHDSYLLEQCDQIVVISEEV
ncbi:ATP-binding cassette domain-containing protein [Enterococcus sp. BWB1-3]|uniref:ATP-binding cassette domain-containing protein n=1 Tax=Enterococcus sp. BWB1-3 TaxID=2787713 RepID=UPI001921C59C|nr:ATP-binding cassette domain-containing protein [Enterococcus sp. BWB1-3]MBL1227834.1 ATP-binding cassette domain-containing protein [Enterococcus sp. BWB1-3]